MEPIVKRMGVLATILSREKQSQYIGIMLTASHNPVQDNGVKLVDVNGQILPDSFEPLAESFANMNDRELLEEIEKAKNKGTGGRVVLGRDTRPSGNHLLQQAHKGISSVNGFALDVGLVTTPQLHAYVAFLNQGIKPEHLEGRYFASLMESLQSFDLKKISLTVDTANGVGALTLSRLAPSLPFPVTIINSGSGVLNHLVS